MTALAAGLLSTGLASPAAAAPVGVTTTVTDAAGNAVDGVARAYRLSDSGSYLLAGAQQVAGGTVNLPVEPGTYKFEFRAEGYLSEFYTDKPSLEAADGVLVSGPAALAPVVLAAAPVMSGVVTTAGGQPLRNVRVVATHQTTYAESSDYTDASGGFSIGAEPGSYKVEAVGGTFGGNYYRGGYFNDKGSEPEADVVVQGAGGTNLGALALSTGGAITGRVTGTGDAPLERVRVSATRVEADGSTSSSYDESDYTDVNGGYAIEGLAPGNYRLTFSDPAEEYLTEYAGDSTVFSSSPQLTLARNQTIAADAALAPVAPFDPSTIDLTGRVTDSSGAPVIGASVAAYTTPASAKNAGRISWTATNRQGVYAFRDLDPAASGSSEDTFKLSVSDLGGREEGQFARIDTFYGGARSYEKAKTVTVPAGAAASGADVVLPLMGGVSGAVSSEDGLSVARAGVEFVNADGDTVASTGVKLDGTYAVRSLPAGVYKARFYDQGFFLGGEVTEIHVPEWYRNGTNIGDAKTITVASGQTTPGIDAALAGSLKAVEKPEIGGKPYVGGTVRARPGVWTLSAATTFSYEWLIDGAVVGTGQRLAISKGWFGEKVVLRVSAENGPHQGVALVTSQKLKRQPKIKIKAGTAATFTVKAKKVKAKKIKGKVVVREIVRTKADGTIKYKKIGKAKIKAGKGKVSLAKVKGKGKHQLEFTFTFKGKVGNAVVVKKVKRKR
ncbi:carboxypeptidase-like regulatory domain-containing protein [Nocardioides houyundeii]|uniref:carboxypeptidase-like regulatory domain-containing protein n=1 Tax=Nocardioides houyundeii TaxID=2045452 RepID=UPI000DF3CA96|nr:carboxypeptidase-like regulatory domain-containing protein [Nocardioides houyundeii]